MGLANIQSEYEFLKKYDAELGTNKAEEYLQKKQEELREKGKTIKTDAQFLADDRVRNNKNYNEKIKLPRDKQRNKLLYYRKLIYESSFQTSKDIYIASLLSIEALDLKASKEVYFPPTILSILIADFVVGEFSGSGDKKAYIPSQAKKRNFHINLLKLKKNKEDSVGSRCLNNGAIKDNFPQNIGKFPSGRIVNRTADTYLRNYGDIIAQTVMQFDINIEIGEDAYLRSILRILVVKICNQIPIQSVLETLNEKNSELYSRGDMLNEVVRICFGESGFDRGDMDSEYMVDYIESTGKFPDGIPFIFVLMYKKFSFQQTCKRFLDNFPSNIQKILYRKMINLKE